MGAAPIAVGRNNWLFAGSLRVDERAAAVMSLLQSAKLNGHDPYAYLKDVLALAHASEQWDCRTAAALLAARAGLKGCGRLTAAVNVCSSDVHLRNTKPAIAGGFQCWEASQASGASIITG